MNISLCNYKKALICIFLFILGEKLVSCYFLDGLSCPADQHMNWDDTCVSSCNAPYQLKEIDQTMYCVPKCSASGFLNADGICSEACSSPMRTVTYGTIQMCQAPCLGSGLYFYEDLGTCFYNCSKPYISSQTNYGLTCLLDITANELNQVKHLVSANKGANTATTVALAASTAIFSFDPTVITGSSLIALVTAVKYINITHSAKLEYMMLNYEPSGGAISSKKLDLSSNTRAKFNTNPPPSIFEKYNTNPSFFISFWPTIVSLLIFLGNCPSTMDF